MANLPSASTSFLAPHQQQKEAIKDQLHVYLKRKKKAGKREVAQQEKQLSEPPEGDKDMLDPVFVHQLLSNAEKLHFYALVELLRLDFRYSLEHAPQTQTLSEGVLEEAAQLEADLTSLLTSIGSLSHVARPPHWSNTLDDFLRLLAAWMVFCTAAFIFPLPFLLLKGVSKSLAHFTPPSVASSCDLYTPVARRFNQVVCSLILQISALKVEVTDERTPEGLALMASHRSVTCYNHTSTIDAFVLPAVSTHFTFMLAKKELFALPFFSWLMAVLGSIPIDRKNRSSAVMSLQLAASCVHPGQTVSISPEGTRSPTGLLLPFKKGPFYLWEAMNTPQQDRAKEGEGCLVQPVLITGAFELFPSASLFSAPGVAQVRLLEPIRPSELPPSSTTADIDKDKESASTSSLQPARDRDAMAVLLRRRLLLASLSPIITSGELLYDTATGTPSNTSPSSTRRSTLTPSERALSIATLLLTLLFTFSFFRSLHSSLHSPPPTGFGFSNGQITCWGCGMSIGITAAIFTYYSLKLKRAKQREGDGAEDIQEEKSKTE